MAPELFSDYRRTFQLAQVSNGCTAVENRDLLRLYHASNCIYNRTGADVAQLVEQSIRNRQVIGSSPIVGSTKFLRFRYMPTLPAGIVFECGGFCGDSHITLRLLR